MLGVSADGELERIPMALNRAQMQDCAPSMRIHRIVDGVLRIPQGVQTFETDTNLARESFLRVS